MTSSPSSSTFVASSRAGASDVIRLPWDRSSRTDEDQAAADERVSFALGHLNIVLNELRTTLDRIEDKRRRGFPT